MFVEMRSVEVFNQGLQISEAMGVNSEVDFWVNWHTNKEVGQFL